MLADEGIDFWLFAYDTGTQEHPIWQLAEQLKLLDCIGFVPFHHEAEPLLLQGDLYLHVLPSTRVQYRTLEAMGRGLTVIAPPNPAADYLLDQQTGRIMIHATPEGWHKARTATSSPTAPKPSPWPAKANNSPATATA